MAAMLARRTTRAKIAILGNGLPLRENPLRIAEEIAMLDVVSGGRIISGFVRGISAEYFSTAVNPTHSRERFLRSGRPDPSRLDGGGAVSLRRPVLSLSLREPRGRAAPEAASAGLVPIAGLDRDGRVGGEAPLPVPDGVHADQADRPDLRRVPRGLRAERLQGQPLPAHREPAHRRGRERRKRAGSLAQNAHLGCTTSACACSRPFWQPPGLH